MRKRKGNYTFGLKIKSIFPMHARMRLAYAKTGRVGDTKLIRNIEKE